jgi:hypothetical protein
MDIANRSRFLNLIASQFSYTVNSICRPGILCSNVTWKNIPTGIFFGIQIIINIFAVSLHGDPYVKA